MSTTTRIEDVSVPLGEDFPEIRESVRRICAGFPGAYWRGLEEREAYPTEFVQALTGAGFLGALIPEEYGGAGLPLRAAAAILEEIHAAGCNAGACHAQMYIMGTLLRHGSPQQKDRYLPKIASGELRLQAFGVTEPTSGTDTTKLKTRAVRDGDHYVVHGQKVWTSRALHSDLMLLLARTTPLEEVSKRTDGLSVFLVDIRECLGKGLEIRPLKAMINHHATEVFFDGMRVPASNLIGQEGKGFRYILDGMNAERILVSSEAIGDARWFTKTAVAYANERVVFGRPIGQNQGIQFPIARAHAETEAAAMLLRKAAALFAAGLPCGDDVNMAKLLASEASWHAAEACLQTHGGFGYAKEYDVERKWRETRLMQIAPISTNLVLSYIAEHVLGLPRSY
ncbi:acyl-CoA dehydrogenase family protein [Ramlibacter sp.]|uniref:acyl-CoA dehydrogenase family protein n=1 Tax=Ramlibacter sp. TaxID=1917967 RepID=UPI002C8A0063|nr:acyl-CoA dehydrogenase family protein [Ramlibacter sp.]HWI82133.1 acyl-CoA dehydrogenase family protein [Ramlibacter sp.]